MCTVYNVLRLTKINNDAKHPSLLVFQRGRGGVQGETK
jgi:hypothetical protein